jgi:RNA polymerase sigma-70 factor (ECF subfamily)
MTDPRQAQSPADEDLMAALRQGDDRALAALYDRYHRLVYSIALAVVGDPPAAQEITQDVFLRLWKDAASYRPERGTLYGWLSRIARNRAIDILRRRASRPAASAVPWSEALAPSSDSEDLPEALIDLEFEKERVRRGLVALPESQRTVIGLAFFKGLTHSEIAEALELPLGTVKGRIRSGMQQLRRSLETE